MSSGGEGPARARPGPGTPPRFGVPVAYPPGGPRRDGRRPGGGRRHVEGRALAGWGRRAAATLL
ncbi:MAG TPA: hypothetical protein VEP73_09410, partial [Actinomycetota bacterium]|nr:hypothetical protein [Actinomycetota bacterium]